MPDTKAVVCSFYTPDDYYRTHADRLRRTLERLGVEHLVTEVVKQPGQDWADICRKKIGILADACERYPEARVFWIDVDCSLLSLPEYLTRSTADLAGFQRGFAPPLRIGYGQRTRFWEPCFFGIGASVGGRAFIRSARELERDNPVKATDDYFFEEAWRANAADLTFQIIPSTAALHRSVASVDSPNQPFFVFGSSGKVAEFRDKVQQHRVTADVGLPWGQRLRGNGLRAAKRLQAVLPRGIATPLRRISDASGLTQTLVGADLAPARLAGAGIASPHRQRLVTAMVMAGQRGDAAGVGDAFARLTASAVPSAGEIAARRAADAFTAYATPVGQRIEPVRLAWWVRPFPGNFGDWLSPLIVRDAARAPVRYQPLTAASRDPHLVAVGSVGRFIKPTSVVVGTGVSSEDAAPDPRARYHSVRGPITAALLRSGGGPSVELFGDPGVLLRRVLPMQPTLSNGKIALVRHFTHVGLPLALPEQVDELEVQVSSPEQIRTLVERLGAYRGVVTSAMHVMIACHSYGIPCALVTFEGLESSVHGSGIKYRDYALGAEAEVREPLALATDLRRMDLYSLMHQHRTSEHVLDRVEAALTDALADLVGRYEDAAESAVAV
jgi:hypothetical protein